MEVYNIRPISKELLNKIRFSSERIEDPFFLLEDFVSQLYSDVEREGYLIEEQPKKR